MSIEPALRAQWSVVIVSFETGELLDRCVESVRGVAPGGTEVVVVDNASTDGSPQRVADRYGVRLTVNERNIGFPQAVNQGLRSCVGDSVVVLNPDAMVPPGFFEAAAAGLDGGLDLLSMAQTGDPGLRASTGAMLTTSELLRQVVLRRRGAAEFGRPVQLGTHEFRPLVAGYLSGFCLVARRSTFDDLGGFDPGLFWAEDVDLSARARATGLSLGVCTSVEVAHEQTHTGRRYGALVTFLQLTAKIGYARRHAPGSTWLIAAAVALTACGRLVWFGLLRRGSPGAPAKALAYRAVIRHVAQRGWRRPDGWDPRTLERLRAARTG